MTLIEHDLTIAKPDYHGGSIVNLMRSIGDACNAPNNGYEPLREFGDRIDGAQRIVLLVIDGLGDELLSAIGEDSILSNHRVGQLTSVYPPTTASAITTFLSGTAPQQHGLTGWFMHFRQLGAVAAVLPFMPRYGRNALSASGVEIGSVLDVGSFFDSIDCASVALMPAEICDSDFSRLTGGRARRAPYASLEDFALQLEEICRAENDVGFVYAYWSELDRLSHLHGPSHAIVAEHLTALDAALTPIFENCASSGTQLIATADHGFIDSGPAERIMLEEHPDLQAMLSLPLCGEPRTAYCYVRPSCIGAFERYVTSEFGEYATLSRSDKLIDDGWFGLGDAHPELGPRIGDYALQMRGRYTISDQVLGERRFDLNGVHGGVTAAELNVPLILAGS